MSNPLKLSGGIEVGRLASAPANPKKGLIYYDTTLDHLRHFDGSSFNRVASQAELDAILGTLDSSPANYTPSEATHSGHLQGIDDALLVAGKDEFGDNVFRIKNLADATKKIGFNASAIGTGLTRNIIMPNNDVDLGDIATNASAIASKANDADVIKKDGSVAFTADQSMGGNKLTNLALPLSVGDAVTKGYADDLAAGLSAKDAAQLATTANITLSGEQTVDGTLTSGSRVVVKNQTDASQNGVYDSATGAWSRSSDFDGAPAAEVKGGVLVFVTEGSVNINTSFRLTGTGEKNVGVDDLDWIVYSRAESTTANDGVTKLGLNFSLTNSGVTDEKVASGIDAAKLADGSVSNTEFQHLDGLTSGVQLQLDLKLENLVEDTTPQLGGNLDLNGKSLEDSANDILIAGQNSVHRAKQASKADFIEEEYIHAIALAASQSDTVIASLTFPHATFEGCEIAYKLKEAVSGDIRLGTIRVATNGTVVVLNDMGTENDETGITFDAAVNAGNINITFSSGANAATMRADVKRFKA